MIEDHSIQQCNTEANEDSTGDAVDNGKGFQRQLVPQFASHHDFANICAHIDKEAHGKDNDPFS